MTPSDHNYDKLFLFVHFAFPGFRVSEGRYFKFGTLADHDK